MFTGIIETVGTVQKKTAEGSNQSFTIAAEIARELKVDQSVSHNGVCLTVESVVEDEYVVTAIEETLSKTNLGLLKAGDKVNLERCMQMNGRIDGHMVQGHVDCTATCSAIREKTGSWEFDFSMDSAYSSLVIEKGSITLNGISLTIFNVGKSSFTVAIIPYTYHHTNIGSVKTGDSVNIEFDMIGKYVNRIMNSRP